MGALNQKVKKFVSEATSVLDSKLSVLAKFAETYEKFAEYSQKAVPIREKRHKHCKVGHSCGNGCCCPPTYNEDGRLVCVWRESGCYTGPKEQVKQLVQQMDQKHSEGQTIKSSFPCSTVPKGEGIKPFYDY